MVRKTNGGFEFYRSDEQIVRFMKVPAIDKLSWLDSCRQLIFSIEDKTFHKIRQKFRKGEI